MHVIVVLLLGAAATHVTSHDLAFGFETKVTARQCGVSMMSSYTAEPERVPVTLTPDSCM